VAIGNGTPGTSTVRPQSINDRSKRLILLLCELRPRSARQMIGILSTGSLGRGRQWSRLCIATKAGWPPSISLGLDRGRRMVARGKHERSNATTTDGH